MWFDHNSKQLNPSLIEIILWVDIKMVSKIGMEEFERYFSKLNSDLSLADILFIRSEKGKNILKLEEGV